MRKPYKRRLRNFLIYPRFLTLALENKIKWMGKTVGPKAPPKVFDATSFITYLISLKSQSETLGWIAGKGFGKSIEEKLDHAKTEIAACRINAAKGTLNAFENEVRATWEEEQREERRGHGEKDSDKRITSQGYALLFFNGKYLLTQIEKRTNLNCPVERNGDHDHDGDDGKKDR